MPRPRLLAFLETSLKGALTLISAPPGYGKTTLMSEWRDGPGQEAGAAWLALDPADNDPTRFFQNLAAAFDTVQPGLALQVQPFLESIQPAQTEAILTAMINLLSPSAQDRFCILDDYHVIENASIHSALAFLIDHLPPNLHLVILTRSDPALPLARWRARGQLNEIRANDLRFSGAETAAFLNQVMGLNITAQEIAALETRTEGWIAGLQLAALSIRGRADISGFIASFTGSHHYIGDYLAEEVLSRQPEPVREFLLQTCILDRLSEPLCTAVTGRSDCQTLLETLEQGNLFLVSLDNERGWYRYHRLFADMLQSHLQRTQKGLLPELHRRASAWYAGQDQVQLALEHALAGGHLDLAARTISDRGESVLAANQWGLLLGWLKVLPDEVIRAYPRLCLLYAWGLAMTGQVDEVEPYLESLGDAHPESIQAEAGLPAGWQGQVAAIRGHVAYLRGDYPMAIRISQSAHDLLPKEDLTTRFYLTMTLCLSQVYSGNLDEAKQLLEEAGRYLEEAGRVNKVLGKPTLMTAAAGMLAEIQEIRGLLREAANTYREILRLAHGRIDPVVISARYHLANVLYEWNDLKNAGTYWQTSLEDADRIYWPEASLLCRLCLARLKIVQGDAPAARELMRQTQEQVDGFAGSNLYDHMTGFLAQLALDLGEIETARTWMTGFTVLFEGSLAENFFLRKMKYLAHVRLLEADGRWLEARRVLARMLQAAEISDLRGCQIEILAWDAAAAAQIARQEKRASSEAQKLLLRALELALPAGYLRTFMDLGKPMEGLIEECQQGLSRQQRQDQDQLALSIERLRAVFGNQPPPAPALADKVKPYLLSPRESELLALIAAGRSNKEIASQLVISLATVKRHTVNIFNKLDVKNRTEAVARARESGLL